MTAAMSCSDTTSRECRCPCGTVHPLHLCCGRYLDGSAQAPTAEALMRSRYTAYHLRNEAYLLATWHASTRPAGLQIAHGSAPGEPAIQWIGLEVKRAQPTGASSAIVEFVARHKTGGRAQRMHEVSRFVCEDGRWFYVGAEMPSL